MLNKGPIDGAFVAVGIHRAPFDLCDPVFLKRGGGPRLVFYRFGSAPLIEAGTKLIVGQVPLWVLRKRFAIAVVHRIHVAERDELGRDGLDMTSV